MARDRRYIIFSDKTNPRPVDVRRAMDTVEPRVFRLKAQLQGHRRELVWVDMAFIRAFTQDGNLWMAGREIVDGKTTENRVLVSLVDNTITIREATDNIE